MKVRRKRIGVFAVVFLLLFMTVGTKSQATGAVEGVTVAAGTTVYTAAETSTAEESTAEPAAAETTAAEESTAELAAVETAAAEESAPESAAAKTTAAEESAAEPAAAETTAAEESAAESATVESVSAGTIVAEPAAAQIIAADADAAQSETENTNVTEIVSCRIVTGQAAQVEVSGTLAAELGEQYDTVYLFALAPYEKEITAQKKPLSEGAVTEDARFLLYTDLNQGEADSVLYSKFAVAVRQENGSYRQVTSCRYITNPEDAAVHTEAFPTAASKKGLMVSVDGSMDSDITNLGVKQALINIVASQLFTTAKASDALAYTYNGTTYYFSENLLGYYDNLCRRLSNKGIVVTAVLLNRYYSGAQYQNLYCAAETDEANYYEFNTQTQAGLNQVAALATFLAERYCGNDVECGRISNWIVGNEVNNQQWNYYGNTDKETYAAAHARTLRVFYTAIRSVSQNARIYMSLGHEWAVSDGGDAWYPGRDILDLVNADISAEGNIDWGVAYHPYPIPLSETSFWDDKVSNDVNATEISFKNLNVLTDYLQTEDFLYEGNVRNVILSEQGFTSIQGFTAMTQRMQAAAFAYAYYIVEANPYIDSFLLSRHIDSPSEVAVGLNLGIWTCKSETNVETVNTKKYIWNVFRDIDTSRSASATSFALELIGVSSWNTALANCHASDSYDTVINRFKNVAAVDTSKLQPSVTYQGYLYGTGWSMAVQNQQTCGTPKSGKRMEAVSVQLTDQPYDGSVQYRSYIRGSGWQSYVKDSDATGGQNTGNSMTALQISLTGTMSKYFDIAYRVYLHDGGWSAWAMDGQVAGNTGSSSYAESVEIILKAKGSLASGNTACKVNDSSKLIFLEGTKNGITVQNAAGYLIPSSGLTFKNSSGQTISGSTKVGTGSSVVYSYENTSGKHSDTWQIAVRGDVNGDAIVNIADITKQVSVIVGKSTVTGIMKEGCDANGDGNINIADITKTVSIIQ